MTWCRPACLIVVGVALVACGSEQTGESNTADEVAAPLAGARLQVYASHNAVETVAVLEAFRAETGRTYRLLSDDMDEREVRLGNPDLMPDTDLYLAASLAEAWAAAEADALRPVFSDVVAGTLPAELRDSESRWFALSRRARVVAYNSDQVDTYALDRLTSYAELADERWRGQLCVSSSAVPGNRVLVAFLISRHGVREAEIIVRGWRANLAMTVFTNDGTLLNAIADGQCGIGLVGSNVLASFLRNSPAARVGMHWFADPDNTVTDISAAAVTRHAAEPAQAEALLEWLVSDSGNALFAGQRFEFPANPASPAGDVVRGWAQNVAPSVSMSELGFLLEEADRLIERARYP